MPPWNSSPTEITTAVTDLLLAIECLLIALLVGHYAHSSRFRVRLWQWILGLTAAAAMLGVFAHAFLWPNTTLALIWMPLYLFLGVTVSLFLVGAIYDWLGTRLATRLVPVAVLTGAGFFVVTQLSEAGFVLLIIFEGIIMLAALTIYVLLSARGVLAGTRLIALAVGLNVVAAAIQASDLSMTVIVAFDHNGLFHLVQMVAVAVLGMGVMRGFEIETAHSRPEGAATR